MTQVKNKGRREEIDRERSKSLGDIVGSTGTAQAIRHPVRAMEQYWNSSDLPAPVKALLGVGQAGLTGIGDVAHVDEEVGRAATGTLVYAASFLPGNDPQEAARVRAAFEQTPGDLATKGRAANEAFAQGNEFLAGLANMALSPSSVATSGGAGLTKLGVGRGLPLLGRAGHAIQGAGDIAQAIEGLPLKPFTYVGGKVAQGVGRRVLASPTGEALAASLGRKISPSRLIQDAEAPVQQALPGVADLPGQVRAPGPRGAVQQALPLGDAPPVRMAPGGRVSPPPTSGHLYATPGVADQSLGITPQIAKDYSKKVAGDTALTDLVTPQEAQELRTLFPKMGDRKLAATIIQGRENQPAIDFADIIGKNWDRAKAGQMTAHDVINAYVPAVLSQRRGAMNPENVLENERTGGFLGNTGLADEVVKGLSQGMGGDAGKYRPEDLAALMLHRTPEGQDLGAALRYGDPQAIQTAIDKFNAVWPAAGIMPGQGPIIPGEFKVDKAGRPLLNKKGEPVPLRGPGDITGGERGALVNAAQDDVFGSIAQMINRMATSGMSGDEVAQVMRDWSASGEGGAMLDRIANGKAGFLTTNLGGPSATFDIRVQKAMKPGATLEDYQRALKIMFPNDDPGLGHHKFWDAQDYTQTPHLGIAESVGNMAAGARFPNPNNAGAFNLPAAMRSRLAGGVMGAASGAALGSLDPETGGPNFSRDNLGNIAAGAAVGGATGAAFGTRPGRVLVQRLMGDVSDQFNIGLPVADLARAMWGDNPTRPQLVRSLAAKMVNGTLDAADRASLPQDVIDEAEEHIATLAKTSVREAFPDIAELTESLRRTRQDPRVKGLDIEQWYEKTWARLEPIFGDETELIMHTLAVTSLQNTVPGNVTHTLKAYAQWKAGGVDAISGMKTGGVTNEVRQLYRDWERTGGFQGHAGAGVAETSRKRTQFVNSFKEGYMRFLAQNDPKAFAAKVASDPQWREYLQARSATPDMWEMRGWGFPTNPNDNQFDQVRGQLIDAGNILGLDPRAYQAAHWFDTMLRWDGQKLVVVPEENAATGVVTGWNPEALEKSLGKGAYENIMIPQITDASGKPRAGWQADILAQAEGNVDAKAREATRLREYATQAIRAIDNAPAPPTDRPSIDIAFKRPLDQIPDAGGTHLLDALRKEDLINKQGVAQAPALDFDVYQGAYRAAKKKEDTPAQVIRFYGTAGEDPADLYERVSTQLKRYMPMSPSKTLLDRFGKLDTKSVYFPDTLPNYGRVAAGTKELGSATYFPYAVVNDPEGLFDPSTTAIRNPAVRGPDGEIHVYERLSEPEDLPAPTPLSPGSDQMAAGISPGIAPQAAVQRQGQNPAQWLNTPVLSGVPGGTRLGMMGSTGLAGAAIGGTQGDTEEERRQNAIQGFGAGAALSAGLTSARGYNLLKNTPIMGQAAKGLLHEALVAQRAAMGRKGQGFKALQSLTTVWKVQATSTLRNLLQDEVTARLWLKDAGVRTQMMNDNWASLVQLYNAGVRDPYLALPQDTTSFLDAVGLHGYVPDVGASFMEANSKMVQGGKLLSQQLSAGDSAKLEAGLSLLNPLQGGIPVLGVGLAGLKGYTRAFQQTLFDQINLFTRVASRHAAFMDTVERDLPGVGDTFARTHGLPSLVGANGLFSPDDVEALVPGLGPLWQKNVDTVVAGAEARAKDILGDYNKKLKGEGLISTVFPFTSYALRAFPRTGKMMLHHPGVSLAIMLLMAKGAHAADQQGLPGYLGGTLPISEDTPVLGGVVRAMAGGADATGYANPAALLSPVGGGLMSGDDLPADANLYQKAAAVGDRVGFGFNPLIEAGAVALNKDYRLPSAPSRTAAIETALPGPELPSLTQGPINFVRQQAGGTPLETTALDRQIAQVFYRATGHALNDPVVQKDPQLRVLALSTLDPSSPLVQQAQAELLQSGVARTTVGMGSPVSVSVRTDVQRVQDQARQDAANLPPAVYDPQEVDQARKSSRLTDQINAMRMARANQGTQATPPPEAGITSGVSRKARAYAALTTWQKQNMALKHFAPEVYAQQEAQLRALLGI